MTLTKPARMRMWADTLKQIEHERYDSMVYNNDNTTRVHDIEVKHPGGEITVVNNDSFGCAADYSHAAVLNFANAFRPALGKPKYGTQEEDLMRRSNLGSYLYEDFKSLRGREAYYPILEGSVVYSRNVMVFKETHGSSCEPFYCDVITAAALDGPLTDGAEFLDVDERQIMLHTVDVIFKSAIANRAKTLVLGAWGCGVFVCPARAVSRMFVDAARKYGNYFDRVVFAIPGDDRELREVFEDAVRSE